MFVSREIFRVLDLMKLDMVNFTISQARPYIQQHSVKYEREKFQLLLNTQKGSCFTYALLHKIFCKYQNHFNYPAII